jgi:hypothetical protein
VKGKFSLKYALTGKNPQDPNQPASEDWYKALGTLIKIAIIIFIATLLIFGMIFIKNILFPKPVQNINMPTFNNPGHVDYSVVQIGSTKKPNINVIPYVDASAGTRSGKYWNGDSTDFEIRAGLRLEMDGLFQTLFGKKEPEKQDVSYAVSQAKTIQDAKDNTVGKVVIDQTSKTVTLAK